MTFQKSATRCWRNVLSSSLTVEAEQGESCPSLTTDERDETSRPGQLDARYLSGVSRVNGETEICVHRPYGSAG